MENEHDALLRLQMLCESSLKAYPQTYEEDLASMKDPSYASKSENYRNILSWRCEEKKILTFWVEFCDFMVKKMEGKLDSAEFELKGKKFDSIDSYMSEQMYPLREAIARGTTMQQVLSQI